MKLRFADACWIGLSSSLFASGAAYAHHGVNGQFDTSKTIEVSGVVSKVRFVNPHSYVYFDVTADDGSVDEWRCELTSGSLLRRKGWSVDMFAEGTEITIHGSPARKEPTACYTETITFADGNTIGRQDSLDESGRAIREGAENGETEIATANLESQGPQLGGNWVSERRERRPPGENGAPPAGSDGTGERPPRSEGGQANPSTEDSAERPRPPRGGGAGGPPRPELTELGKVAVEGFQREDNPRFHCQATNILVDWWFDQLVNRIEQTDDDIKLTYGFMDIVRTIHLDIEEHPENIEPSIAGHSIGKWEGNVLTVDTIGFSEGYLNVPPNVEGVARNSTELHIVEKFTLSDDGTTLTRKYVADDPLYLVGTFSGEDVVKRTDADYESYACEDLTGDTY